MTSIASLHRNFHFSLLKVIVWKEGEEEIPVEDTHLHYLCGVSPTSVCILLNSHLFALKWSHHTVKGQILIQNHDVGSEITSSVGSGL